MCDYLNVCIKIVLLPKSDRQGDNVTMESRSEGDTVASLQHPLQKQLVHRGYMVNAHHHR